jgi:thiamine-monophosphate kinase
MPLDEDGFIARHLRPLAGEGAHGLVDDCATLTVPDGEMLVVTCDALCAGVHFFADDPPEAIAKKALRVNLSDLAAKAAEPAGYLLTLALPADICEDWLARFCAGLDGDQRLYAISLLGGDTTRTPGPLMLSITAFGTVPRGRYPGRDRARAGDALLVTGTVGDAALGLRLRHDPGAADGWGLDSAARDHLLARYLLPEPRVGALARVADRVRAAMDISDGLALDAARLARVSGLQARIDASAVPLSDAARCAVAGDPEMMELVLTGGDDFELLLAVPERDVDEVRCAIEHEGVEVTRVGRLQEGAAGVVVLGTDGMPLDLSRLGYQHF